MFNFFFQSDQEQRVREDVQKNLQICISNSKKYEGAKQVLEMHVTTSNQRQIQRIVDNIKATIKDQDLQPVRKYQAILLLRDLMRTHNKALGKYVVKKTLKRLTILAQHKNGTSDQADQDRGKDIFGKVKRDQQAYSVKFLNVLLSALEEWGKNWPKTPGGPYEDFHRQYNDLLINGVRFPKERPKEAIKPQTSRSPSPAPTGKSIEKPTTSSKSVPKKAAVPVRDVKQSVTLKPALQREFQQFYEDMMEPIGLFGQCLGEGDIESFPFLRQIVSQMSKASEKGNQLIIKLQGAAATGPDAKKVEAVFTFIDNIGAEMNKVSKKPELFDKFKDKYVKSSKATLKMLREKPVEKNTSKEQLSENPSSSIIKEEKTPKQPERDKPKIKNPNRYTSTSGQVLEQFAEKPSDPSDPKENSINSSRYGSFGGPNQRHRATITTDSPGEKKKDRQKQIEKQNSDSKNEIRNQSPPIPKQKVKQIEKKVQPVQQKIEKKVDIKKEVKVQKKVEIKNPKTTPALKTTEPEKVIETKTALTQKADKINESLNKSQDFFKQFNQDSSKNVPAVTGQNPFKDNDSFGGFGAQKKVDKVDDQDDFFTKKENEKQQTNNLGKITNRRKAPVKNNKVQKDFFEDNSPSNVSDGLSAFQTKKNIKDSQISSNITPKKVQDQPDSKKSINFDNPFGLQSQMLKQKVSEHNKSLDFFNEFERKSGKHPISSDDVFQLQPQINIENRPSEGQQNPFATGNFGGMVAEARKESAQNPFETESRHSNKVPYASSSNPFHEQSFEAREKASQGSKKLNPFETVSQQPSGLNPFETKTEQNSFQQQNMFSKKKEPSNPFETKTQQQSNPFETSTHKSQKQGIQSILDIFKPSDKKIVENLSQRGSFKQIDPKQIQYPGEENGRNSGGAPQRDSVAFTINMEKQSEPGLNFSQFQDVPGNKQNPFGSFHEKKSNQQNQSGFSLSNFTPVGGDPFAAHASNDPFAAPVGRSSELAKSNDFFAGFQNKHSVKSKYSGESKKQEKEEPQQNMKRTRDFFADFNVTNRSDNFVEKKSEPQRFIEQQKTVKSSSQKSFDFSQLQNTSKIQKQGKKKVQEEKKPNNIIDFDGWGNKDTSSRKEKKQQFQDNESETWGVFDKQKKQAIFEERSKSAKTDDFDAFKSNMLQMQSRNGQLSKRKDPILSDRELGSKLTKTNQQLSLDLNLQDFAPISKKGIEWNPLNLIPNLKPQAVVYMVDHQKIKMKKLELDEKRNQYNDNVKEFKKAKQKNNQIRGKFLEKMKKVDEVLQQKAEYHQILKKIKEGNDIKQKQISEINKKIKTVEEFKTKILQKQKLLYEITKKQIKFQDKKAPVQRTTASKWQMFNKNLQSYRNNAVTMTRMSYQGL